MNDILSLKNRSEKPHFIRLYIMRYKWILYTLTTLLVVSCNSYKQVDKHHQTERVAPQYVITNISGQIVEMNHEQGTHAEMQALVDKYKGTLDKQMNEVLGTTTEFMQKGRPESLLTNFTSDVMKAYGDKNLEAGADVAIMNVNGHRSTLPKGELTLGNLFEVYSFDNAISYIELKGEDLIKIFEAYARIGVQASHQMLVNNK